MQPNYLPHRESSSDGTPSHHLHRVVLPAQEIILPNPRITINLKTIIKALEKGLSRDPHYTVQRLDIINKTERPNVYYGLLHQDSSSFPIIVKRIKDNYEIRFDNDDEPLVVDKNTPRVREKIQPEINLCNTRISVVC